MAVDLTNGADDICANFGTLAPREIWELLLTRFTDPQDGYERLVVGILAENISYDCHHHLLDNWRFEKGFYQPVLGNFYRYCKLIGLHGDRVKEMIK